MSNAIVLDTGAAPGTLAGLLDMLAARDIRLKVASNGRTFSLDAPRGAITPELRAAIRAQKGELLAALTSTPAPARAGLHVCRWGAPHYGRWRYSREERRYICLACYPELAGAIAREEAQERQGETLAPIGEELAGEAQASQEAPHVRARRIAWIIEARRELAAYGLARDWPRLAIAYSTGAGSHRAPYCAIMAGASAWALFLAGASGRELAAAYRAAGLATPRQEQRQEAQEQRQEAQKAPAPALASTPHRTRSGRGKGEGETLAALDTAGLWIARPGEALICVREGIPAPSPEVHAGELLALAQRHTISQLWVHPSWALAAGLPSRMGAVKPSEGLAHAFTDTAIASGWDIRPAGLAPWLYCFQRGTYGGIALAFPHLDTRVAWREARDARELLGALLAYREALAGYGYRRSPGATGTGLLRALHSGNRVALDLSASAAPGDFPAPARAGHAAPDLIWARPLTGEERDTCAYVNAYDKNAMYLGASASLPLGLGTPEHCAGEGLTFDKRIAGYWHARIDYAAPSGMPNPFAAPIHPTDSEGASWYPSPLIELAYQEGAAVTLLEAYIWRSSHRLMAPWYARMRDARAALLDRAASDPAAAIALGAVKRTYTQAIGWLNGGWLRRSEAPEDLYRPDWRDAIMAQAAANLYRELLKVQRETGRVPFALDTDAAYFASASADAIATCPAPLILGTGLRHMKVKTSGAPLAPVITLLDTLQGAGASVGRMVDEIHATVQGASQGEEA